MLYLALNLNRITNAKNKVSKLQTSTIGGMAMKEKPRQGVILIDRGTRKKVFVLS